MILFLIFILSQFFIFFPQNPIFYVLILHEVMQPTYAIMSNFRKKTLLRVENNQKSLQIAAYYDYNLPCKHNLKKDNFRHDASIGLFPPHASTLGGDRRTSYRDNFSHVWRSRRIFRFSRNRAHNISSG